ncbi:ribosomal protein S16 [Fomitopsis betulina]|nr:ribosomal protein S16 [Fomitopsis betulina]
MVVRLRLSLHGQRNHKTYRLDAVPSRLRRNAKPIEVLGMWDPRTPLGETTKEVRWSVDRIKYWLGVGAQPSKRVQKMLDIAGIQPEHKGPKSSHSDVAAHLQQTLPTSQPAQSS